MKRLLERLSIIDLLFTSGIRKTLVILIFSCMLINGFIPKSIESGGSLFMVMTAVVSNAVTDIFEECRDTLTLISNKITKDLYKILSLGEVSTTSPIENTDDKEPMPVNTSSDNGIMTEKRVSGHWNSGEARIEKDWYGEPIIISKLYRLYENIKIYDGAASKLGVLFFILFIGVIRSRKEISIKKTNGVKEYKTDLCL
mgnify:CR=1 FL=1